MGSKNLMPPGFRRNKGAAVFFMGWRAMKVSLRLLTSLAFRAGKVYRGKMAKEEGKNAFSREGDLLHKKVLLLTLLSAAGTFLEKAKFNCLVLQSQNFFLFLFS